MHSEAMSLRIVDIQKRLGAFELGPANMEVPSGSVVGLIGQNGAGKTTLMKTALGMLRPDAGRIELFGQDPQTLGSRTHAALKAHVAYVASESAYPLEMTVAEVARLYALAYPNFDAATFDEMRGDLGIGSKNRKTSELSRGMGMKLQLICAIASGAKLLVLDEPTAGLDPVVRGEALDALRAWMEPGDRSVLISSHITSDLEHLADYIVMMHEGHVAIACDQDELSAMGVARLRAEELNRVLAEGTYQPGALRKISRDLSQELLVPNRLAFLHAHPNCVCDRASIDDVMTFVAKGEVI